MRHPGLSGLFFLEGHWRYEIVTPSGTVRRSKWLRNGITTAGLNDLGEVYFRAASQRTAWYAGLINSSGFAALAAADTMSSHAGWSDFTGFSETARPQWQPSPAAGGRLLNGSAMVFSMTAPATLEGMYLVSDSTKGGTAGLLWSTALFDAPENLLQAEVLRLYYDLTAAPGAG